MIAAIDSRTLDRDDRAAPPEVEVVIEIPRGSFLKRGSTGHIDFVSPLPCPFNYGSVPAYLGLEGDLLDALVLGPRLRVGTRVQVPAWGAVILMDRGMTDDKLVCSSRPISARERRQVLRFFRFYARCKGLLNLWRRRPGAMLRWLVRCGRGARPRPSRAARTGTDRRSTSESCGGCPDPDPRTLSGWSRTSTLSRSARTRAASGTRQTCRC